MVYYIVNQANILNIIKKLKYIIFLIDHCDYSPIYRLGNCYLNRLVPIPNFYNLGFRVLKKYQLYKIMYIDMSI